VHQHSTSQHAFRNNQAVDQYHARNTLRLQSSVFHQIFNWCNTDKEFWWCHL